MSKREDLEQVAATLCGGFSWRAHKPHSHLGGGEHYLSQSGQQVGVITAQVVWHVWVRNPDDDPDSEWWERDPDGEANTLAKAKAACEELARRAKA